MKIVTILGFSSQLQYPEPNARLSARALETLVQMIPSYQSLYLAKAFFRKGVNEIDRFEYVSAFYQFYFIIEDFFSEGEFLWKILKDKYANSAEYIKVARLTIEAITKDPRHKDNLERFLAEENCQLTPEGLQELLHKVRGRVHHYSSNNPRNRGTPFNQNEYETIALTSMYLTNLAIGLRA